jgi:hypothetical protein
MHAKKRWPQLHGDPSKIASIPWHFFRKHMRFICPDPVTIMLALQAAFLCFSKVIDPGSGKSFLLGTWRSLLRTQLKYVAAGLLSDCPSVSMYMAMGKMACGLIIYRCLRGSSALEGYHAHLRRLLEHCYSASDETRDAIVNCFDFRFNVRAARAASLFDPNVKHYNMALLDEIDSLLLALGTQGLELHRQVADKPALMVHGSHFSELALKQGGAELDAAAAAGGEEELCTKKWKLRPDSDDKAALIQHACFSTGTASELCTVARSRHIFWDAGDAERFKQAVALGEAKQAALAGAGYAALHAAQRVPATAPDALRAPAAAALPAPPGGALMPLAAPIHSAAAGAAGAPRHDPAAARMIGPAPPPQAFVGPLQPAAAPVSAAEAAPAASGVAARKKGRGAGGGRKRKEGGSAAKQEKRQKQREWAEKSRKKKSMAAQNGAGDNGGDPQ